MREPMSLSGISSMATRWVLADLADAYVQRTGRRVVIESVGGVAALKRVLEGEAFDIAVLASDALDTLAAAGRIDASSRVSLARSGVAAAVASGAVHPSIASEDDVRDAVRAARSIGYSTGPSGVHLLALFERWGIADEIASRIVQAPPGVAVGSLIATGQVEIGFQQTSELIGVAGIDVLGPLPDGIQVLTVFQAALCVGAVSPGAAREWLAFVISPEVDLLKLRCGMEGV
jgi:molybdate transport system substrate-binding protein